MTSDQPDCWCCTDMLQSLFESQILTLGVVVIALMGTVDLFQVP